MASTKHTADSAAIADQRAGWDRIDSLLREHGPSLYLVRLDRFEHNCRALLAAMQQYYPRTRLGYSYKTNYTPAICRRADQLGCYAEVVSRMELDLALRLGVPGNRIIFNGPVKSKDDLLTAAKAGATIHVDHVQEIEALAEIVCHHDDFKPRVGVRCCFPLASEHRSRFGFDAESGGVAAAVTQLRRIPGCRVAGLHCHFSHHRDAPSYRRRAERMVALARECFADQPIEFLDIGGGFCGKLPDELQQQFAERLPSYEDYAKAIGEVVQQAFPADGPELILEPGMGVVADCTEFAARVTATKTIGDRNYIVTAGSIYNIKPTLNKLNLPIEVLHSPGNRSSSASPQTADVVGFTCMEIDVMYRGLAEQVDPGDILVFSNVGAYTTVLLPPFIRPAPAMIAVDGDQAVLLRHPQTLDDVLTSYVLG